LAIQGLYEKSAYFLCEVLEEPNAGNGMFLIERVHELHPLDEVLHVFYLGDDVLAQNCCKLDGMKARV
jgi:hypothetical protein